MGGYYVSPSGETEDQSPQTQTPPQSTSANAATPAQTKGPFAQYLDPSQTAQPTHTASQQRPSGYMGAGGKVAMLADKLLGGFAKGRSDAYNKSIQQSALEYKKLNSAHEDIDRSGLSDADKAHAHQQVDQLKAQFVAGETDPSAKGKDGKPGKGGGKGEKEHENPIMGFFHKAALTLAGPGAEPLPFSPQAVNERLGQVYSFMSTQKSAVEQQGQAVQDFLGAIGTAAKSGADHTEVLKSPEVAAAAGKLAKLYNGQIPPSVLKMAEDTLRPTQLLDATIKNQKDELEHVKQDRFGNYYRNGVQIDPSEIKDAGKQLDRQQRAPTKFETDLADSKSYLGSLLGKDEKKFSKEEAHIAERLAGSDRDFRTRFEVNVKKGLAPEKAYDAANAAHVKSLDSKQTGLDLGNALKSLGYQYKKEDRQKFKPEEIQRTSHAVFNDVFLNQDPEVQSWATKLRDRMLDAKANPKDAASAANELRGAVMKNVESQDNYTDLTDEQRKQVISSVRGMEWDKVVPYVKGAGAASSKSPFTVMGKKPSTAAGAPASEVKTSPPPGSAQPTAKPSAQPAAKQAAPAEKAKVLGTESQLRAKAKAAGKSAKEIDQMVKDYKQAGYIK